MVTNNIVFVIHIHIFNSPASFYVINKFTDSCVLDIVIRREAQLYASICFSTSKTVDY